MARHGTRGRRARVYGAERDGTARRAKVDGTEGGGEAYDRGVDKAREETRRDPGTASERTPTLPCSYDGETRVDGRGSARVEGERWGRCVHAMRSRTRDGSS